MTKLRGFIPTTLMLITLTLGATAANAGIIVGDRQGAKSSKSNTCEEPTTDGMVYSLLESFATFAKTGIIVGDRTGIIVGDRVGIIVGDRTSSSQETCGIIVSD